MSLFSSRVRTALVSVAILGMTSSCDVTPTQNDPGHTDELVVRATSGEIAGAEEPRNPPRRRFLGSLGELEGAESGGLEGDEPRNWVPHSTEHQYRTRK